MIACAASNSDFQAVAAAPLATAAGPIDTASGAEILRSPAAITVRFGTNRNKADEKMVFGPSLMDPTNGNVYVTGTIIVRPSGTGPDATWTADRSSVHLDPQQTPPADNPLAAEVVQAALGAKTGEIAFIESAPPAEQPRAQAATGAKKLVFIPGFNNTFIDSVETAAKVAYRYRFADIFCFSWPSAGELSLTAYDHDRRYADASGGAIALSMVKIFKAYLSLRADARPDLRILCHSMGNRAFQAALKFIKADPKYEDLLGKLYFRTALLMAADVAYSALEDKELLGHLFDMASSVAVYSSRSDFAMRLSSFANLWEPLGYDGPAHLDRLSTKVQVVDCTHVGRLPGSDAAGHQYFQRIDVVINDAVQVLAGTDPCQIQPREPDPTCGTRRFVIPAPASLDVCP